MFTSRDVSTLSVLLNDPPSAPSAELQNPKKRTQREDAGAAGARNGHV